VPGTTVEALSAGLDEARRAGGDLCVATHYWELDAALRPVLTAFLDVAAAQRDVRFVRAEELFA
jgi:hypothetical protein